MKLDLVNFEDLSILDKIQEEAFYDYESHGLDVSTFKKPSTIYNRKNFNIYKIVENGNIIGALFIKELNFFSCEIHRLFLAKKFQGKGYGSKVIQLLCDNTKQYVLYKTSTPKALESNCNFYKKNNFILMETKKNKGIEMCYFELEVARNVVTGLKPSDGGLHLGHYIGNIDMLLKMQKNPNYKCNFIFADLQLINENRTYYTKEKVLANMKLMVKQMIALGVDVTRVNIVIESEIKNNRLDDFVFLSDYFDEKRIKRMPLFKYYSEKSKQNIKMSLLNYPILQAMDFVIFDADIVLSNSDNKPCVELINEVIRKINNSLQINRIKTAKLITGVVPFLEGVDGDKMSKKKNNCILFLDSDEILKQKINKMYTDNNRLSIHTPGNITNNIVFKYLNIFGEVDKVKEIISLYKRGEIGDKEVKDTLFIYMKNAFDKYRNKFNNVNDRIVDFYIHY